MKRLPYIRCFRLRFDGADEVYLFGSQSLCLQLFGPNLPLPATRSHHPLRRPAGNRHRRRNPRPTFLPTQRTMHTNPMRAIWPLPIWRRFLNYSKPCNCAGEIGACLGIPDAVTAGVLTAFLLYGIAGSLYFLQKEKLNSTNDPS